ncbi:MAG: hypothetical protein Q7V58_06855 [Actinomycetota bacterium]|nr:hypothetical protein [Actinomycetota bacterium]
MFILDNLDWAGNWVVALCYLFGILFGVIFIGMMILSAAYLVIDALLDCIPAVRRKREASARRPVGSA